MVEVQVGAVPRSEMQIPSQISLWTADVVVCGYDYVVKHPSVYGMHPRSPMAQV